MLEAVGLSKRFGALVVVNGVSLSVAAGERRVVLGPNGAGKTTLFNLLAGELRPDAGSIRIAGRDVTRLAPDARARLGLARSYQRNSLFAGLTVAENLSLAAATAQGRAGTLVRDTMREPAVAETVAEVAARIGLASHLAQPVDAIPYGDRRRLELGLALAARPRVLLMDEPTSGIGPGGIAAVHSVLRALPADLALIVVEHDMDLAFQLADQVTVLDHGEVVFEGPPAAARASRLVREIYLGRWGGDA